jgi:hypothetical protein
MVGGGRRYLNVLFEGEDGFRVSDGQREMLVSYTDLPSIAALLPDSAVYVDITGLTHSTWAAILRALRRHAHPVFFIYTEPDSYAAHSSPSSNNLFDLSLSAEGIKPLPGLANLSGPLPTSRTLLVAFLGFETARAEHVVGSVDPQPPMIPIVALPGYRIDYPQFTVSSNDQLLRESRVAHKVRFAKGSCPFEAYTLLREIGEEYPAAYMYIGLTGTKPHAVGAVLFALENPATTELIYDHPRRKPGRSSGIGVTHIYLLHNADTR